jgi:nucleotide-binding universal stress UspA family protein
MHLTVGYLATPTGDDGVALDATVDVLLVVREEMPDGHPRRAAYQQLLVERGEKWISTAVDALAAKDVNASSTVLIGESFVGSLIAFAEERNSDLIVVGGARDGFFGGHAVGPVSQALLHHSPIPVALAPRGYAEDPPDAVGAVTAAVPTRPGPDNPLPFAITLASSASLPIRTVTLLSAENLSEAGDVADCAGYNWRPPRTFVRWPLAHCPTHRRSNAWLPTA